MSRNLFAQKLFTSHSWPVLCRNIPILQTSLYLAGVILPGDKMKFPFVFKSSLAGVFSEQWELETSPVVCGGAAMIVTLRGVALQEDKYKQQRTKIEVR